MSLKGRLEHHNVLPSQLSCHFNSFVSRYCHKVFDIAHLVAGGTNAHFSTCTCTPTQCSNSQLTRCNGLSTERDPVTSRNHAFKQSTKSACAITHVLLHAVTVVAR